jgi:hypothetical protein
VAAAVEMKREAPKQGRVAPANHPNIPSASLSPPPRTRINAQRLAYFQAFENPDSTSPEGALAFADLLKVATFMVGDKLADGTLVNLVERVTELVRVCTIFCVIGTFV